MRRGLLQNEMSPASQILRPNKPHPSPVAIGNHLPSQLRYQSSILMVHVSNSHSFETFQSKNSIPWFEEEVAWFCVIFSAKEIPKFPIHPVCDLFRSSKKLHLVCSDCLGYGLNKSSSASHRKAPGFPTCQLAGYLLHNPTECFIFDVNLQNGCPKCFLVWSYSFMCRSRHNLFLVQVGTLQLKCIELLDQLMVCPVYWQYYWRVECTSIASTSIASSSFSLGCCLIQHPR